MEVKTTEHIVCRNHYEYRVKIEHTIGLTTISVYSEFNDLREVIRMDSTLETACSAYKLIYYSYCELALLNDEDLASAVVGLWLADTY